MLKGDQTIKFFWQLLTIRALITAAHTGCSHACSESKISRKSCMEQALIKGDCPVSLGKTQPYRLVPHCCECCRRHYGSYPRRAAQNQLRFSLSRRVLSSSCYVFLSANLPSRQWRLHRGGGWGFPLLRT